MPTDPSVRYCTPARGPYRIRVEIESKRVVVLCQNNAVRVIVRRADAAPMIETDLVERVEVATWNRPEQDEAETEERQLPLSLSNFRAARQATAGDGQRRRSSARSTPRKQRSPIAASA
jgi:hypothetical protein